MKKTMTTILVILLIFAMFPGSVFAKNKKGEVITVYSSLEYKLGLYENAKYRMKVTFAPEINKGIFFNNTGGEVLIKVYRAENLKKVHAEYSIKAEKPKKKIPFLKTEEELKMRTYEDIMLSDKEGEKIFDKLNAIADAERRAGIYFAIAEGGADEVEVIVEDVINELRKDSSKDALKDLVDRYEEIITPGAGDAFMELVSSLSFCPPPDEPYEWVKKANLEAAALDVPFGWEFLVPVKLMVYDFCKKVWGMDFIRQAGMAALQPSSEDILGVYYDNLPPASDELAQMIVTLSENQKD